MDKRDKFGMKTCQILIKQQNRCPETNEIKLNTEFELCVLKIKEKHQLKFKF